MKRVLSALLVLGFIFLSSCSKSSVDSSISPLEKQYKGLTSDNVTSFFVETSKAYKGCAGVNCNSVFNFGFQNLSYLTEIAITVYSNTPNPIWSYYTTEKQDVTTYGNWYANEYRLRFTLKDGRVLSGPWIKF